MNSFYLEKEFGYIGFKHIGRNVQISRFANFYGAEEIEIGDNVRIDDFSILSGRVVIKSHIHIAAYSALYGGTEGIFIDDYSNISSRVCVYSINDDYSGETMTNPTIPDTYKSIDSRRVLIGKHVIIGSGTTVLPGVDIAEGTAIGTMSLCKMSTKPWTIYAGISMVEIKERSKKLLMLAKHFENREGGVLLTTDIDVNVYRSYLFFEKLQCIA